MYADAAGNPVSFCQTRRNGLFQDSFVRRRISLSGFNISDQNFLETYEMCIRDRYKAAKK